MTQSEPLVTEAITLKALPYKERGMIVTVFSREKGVLSLFIKRQNVKRQKRHLSETYIEESFASGLVKAELTIVPSATGLWRCQRATVMHNYSELRTDFDRLQLAATFLNHILISQLQEAATPILYNLLEAYLKKLALSLNPHTLLASFQLKLLKYEGLLHELTFQEWLQKEILPFPLTEEETLLILYLLHSRSLTEVDALPLDSALIDKIHSLFLYLTHQKHL